jgi:hypothetical protein
MPENTFVQGRCRLCSTRSDAHPFEHAARAVASLSDTERTVLTAYIKLLERRAHDPHAELRWLSALPAALRNAVEQPRPNVLHAHTLMSLLDDEDSADAATLYQILIAGRWSNG